MQTFRLNLRLQYSAVFGAIFLMLTLCAVAFGQQVTGTIKGQVSDEFGGVIVGASVVAVDASGTKKTATTNGEGNFVITGLAAGKYTVQVKDHGIATYENSEFVLSTYRTQPI